MTTSVAIEQPKSNSLSSRVFSFIPGVILLAAIGYAGKFIEQSVSRYGKSHHLSLPNIEYVLWAILIGLAISNTVRIPELFKAGIATYEFWLKVGIVLLGARFLLGDVIKLGGLSLALVVIELALAIALMTALGRVFKLSPKLTTLLAVGSSICGVSAIIAAKGAIDADDEDSSLAIAAILALGAIALFTFPFIGHLLGMSNHAYGLWSGLAVDNTAEAVAAGALYSDAAGKIAVLGQDCQERDDRVCCSRLCDLLGEQRTGSNRPQQGSVPVAEVSQVRSWIPADIDSGYGRRFQQGSDRESGEFVPLGFLAHICRCRTPNQSARNAEAGVASLHRGSGGRNSDRGGDSRPCPGRR